MHIESLGLRSLRKLNLNHDLRNQSFRIDAIEHLHVSAINVLVGPNGGGKSTVVDLVRAMGDPSVLATLGRENITRETSSGFVVQFRAGASVTAMFNTPSIDEFGLAMITTLPTGEQRRFAGKIKKHDGKTLPGAASDTIKLLSVQVDYRDRHDESEVPIQQFIDVLNANAAYLSGLAPFPLMPDQSAYIGPMNASLKAWNAKTPITLLPDGFLRICFNDDERQENNVPLGMLPSGWKAFGGLLGWLETRHKGAICVIEEPETHIHPRLLRVLMRRISEQVQARELQVFLTTHSATFIDINTWPQKNVTLIEADGYRVRELTNASLALGNLGVRPSDVCQANGVIWVEGPSDRLYLLHWLALWCAKHGKETPIENVEFSILPYGGATLCHFSGSSDDQLIDVFGINRNSILIMDQDLDFIPDASGRETPKNLSSAKARIYEDFSKSASVGKFCWLTQDYTIESYLPLEFRDAYFRYNNEGRLKQKSAHSKVEIAERFRCEFDNFDSSHDPSGNLPSWIKQIHEAIGLWNS